ncbi:DUF1850 domain-containing protein [Marinithermus hydrothermalis]|uniref:DUF1850 domain-containing protein n=1 Tax=Marinithermus hydrothermalis (strain DSM 14884 / JCM 11576 / T1) TaxID=869210 RepID=F2NQV7_MARHT|nr:DUF1850 domain-containing protein [Marinithermus hydrothermalis]AEB12321.1 Domain of unknown function DUF1850 [Marinithermus hydrothermalis DSM 14884]
MRGLLGVGLLLGLGALAFFLGVQRGVWVEVDGRGVLFLPLKEEERFALSWVHSVDGIRVWDVFEYREGRVYLVETRTPYFAAGLGEVPGRGRVVGMAGHALAIVGIDEPLEGWVLRIGSPEVRHTLHHRGCAYDLSARYAHRRLTFRPGVRLGLGRGEACATW